MLYCCVTLRDTESEMDTVYELSSGTLDSGHTDGHRLVQWAVRTGDDGGKWRVNCDGQDLDDADGGRHMSRN